MNKIEGPFLVVRTIAAIAGALLCDAPGVSLDNITITMQAKGRPGGEPGAARMLEPQPMTWSEHTAKHDFVMREGKWQVIKVSPLSLESGMLHVLFNMARYKKLTGSPLCCMTSVVVYVLILSFFLAIAE